MTLPQMIKLTDAAKYLQDQGAPIPYATLYHWAKKGVTIDTKHRRLGTQIGNRWYIYETELGELLNAIRSGKSIQITSTTRTKETRGRKADKHSTEEKKTSR